VHHQNNHAGEDTNDQSNGNSPSPKLGTGHSIRPRPAMPSTVPGADMNDRSLLLHGWPDAPSAYLRLPDTVPLKRRATALGAAIVEGKVLGDGSIALPAPTVQPRWIPEHRW